MAGHDFSETDLSALDDGNQAFWSKLDEESDLGMVLSAGAYFEKKLSSCLKYYFVKGQFAEKLLSPTGAIGGLTARLDSALCLRIIDKEQHTCLSKLAKIRNKFAHNLHASFEDRSIKDQVDDFWKSYFSDRLIAEMRKSDSFEAAREKFVFTCFSLGMDLSHRELDVWMHTRRYSVLIPDHLAEAINEAGSQ